MFDPAINMNHESIVETTEKLPRLVEIAGPAGAGKTTLLRALSERHKGIRPGLGLSRFDKIPFFIGNTVSMLPTFLRYHRRGRWFNWRESRSMVYLQAGLRALRQKGSGNDAITVLDHGPIYRLTTLCEFGPELTTNRRYVRWWSDLFSEWASVLDMFIWLDAPNEILLDRIRGRERWHMIKEESDWEAYEFLARYRRAMERLIARAVTDCQQRVLRFDTSQKSVEQIADKVLRTFDAVP